MGITREGKFDTQWGVVETFEKSETCEDECSGCGYVGDDFREVSGHNGWDSYSYTECPRCGNDRKIADEIKKVSGKITKKVLLDIVNRIYPEVKQNV